MEVKDSAFQTPITIGEAIESIHRKKYLLPAIQREFVWSPEQIVKIFDSLMRDYPIGSFLFWDVDNEQINNFQFYEFITNFHERDNTHNPKADIKGEENITAILDGQQRLTALYLAMKGTYAYKTPWKRWDNDEAFPKRKLYLNLLSESEEFGSLYDFKFLTEDETSENDDNNFWFEVGKILDLQDEYEVNNYLIANNLMSHPNKEKAQFANKTLFKLHSLIHKNRIINYYLEKSQKLDKVLNIFIRVNSGGTQLSYSDLLLSIATAQWQTKDARAEITSFVDEINRIGEGFDFDKDFVLKSCLVLSDLTEIAFKVDNFNSENMKKIEDRWEDINKAIKLSVELVSSFGYNYQNLTSANALIPVAYYILKEGNPESFIQSVNFKDDRNNIKKWFTLSLIKRVFSGQPDNVLRPTRNIIQEKSETFPLTVIIDKFKGTNKSLVFTEDDIDSLLYYKYGQSHTFSVLSLLYPTLDLRNRFHQDHIFPKSFFTKSKLNKKGVNEDKQEFFLDNYNFIGNLQMLEGIPNEEKSYKDFNEWLEQIFTSEQEKKDYMKKHYIPQDISLEFDNFDKFIEERNTLIKSRFNEILT